MEGVRHEIVVLGAGWQQVPLLLAARRRGLRTVALDRDHDAAGAALCDVFLGVDVSDVGGCVAALAGRSPSGVVTTGVDAAVASQAAIAAAFDLAGPSVESAARLGDKHRFSAVASHIGLRRADQVVATSLEHLQGELGRGPLPAVVKPSNSSGSRGVSVVRRDGDAAAAWVEASTALRPGGSILLEEHIDGLEHGIQYISVRTSSGGYEISVPHNDTMSPNGIGPTGHSLPIADTEAGAAALEIARSIARELGLHNVPLNIDLIRSDDGDTYVIEAAGRFAGGCLPRLIEMMYGISIYDVLIDLALGDHPQWETTPRCGGAAARYITSPEEGRLVDILLPEIDADIQIDIVARPGDLCRRYTSASNALGTIFATASCTDIAEQRAADVARSIEVRVA